MYRPAGMLRGTHTIEYVLTGKGHIFPNKFREIDVRFRSTRYNNTVKCRNIYNGNRKSNPHIPERNFIVGKVKERSILLPFDQSELKRSEYKFISLSVSVV